MKKILTIIIMFMIGFTMVGCSCKKDETIMLEDNQYFSGEGNIDFLATFNPIQEKINSKSHKTDLFLFIWIYIYYIVDTFLCSGIYI